jgi:hypothetical protein
MFCGHFGIFYQEKSGNPAKVSLIGFHNEFTETRPSAHSPFAKLKKID